MYAFGSSITNRFDPKTSDIDLLVEVDVADPADRGETLLSLWDQLELLFERKVDLLTGASIKNPYLKKTIDCTKKVIYDRAREEVILIHSYDNVDDSIIWSILTRHLSPLKEEVDNLLSP